jgi:histidinol-phosphate/aromatic aminotransferase/cobyric acid decarboxylase-like protein
VTLPPPGEHGGDGARLAAALGLHPDDVLDLSASLNPCAPDVAAQAAAHLASLRRYPDDEPATAATAAALGVDAERVVLTNGGAEAIALVAAELGAGWVEHPDFSLYERHLAQLDPHGGRWRSNPRNPTGELAPPDAVAAVWDEAFWALATGTWTRGAGIVVGSLTKVFACPGLRVGYVLAPGAGFAAAIRRRRPAWSVSGLACALVPELIAGADLPVWRDAIVELRAGLVEALDGLDVHAADAPWVLVRGAGDLRDRLARHGILVRDCTSFGLPGTVRIAVPDEAGLTRLRGALHAPPAGSSTGEAVDARITFMPGLPRAKVWQHPRLLAEHAFDKLRMLDCTFAEFDAAIEHAEVIEEHDLGDESLKELVLAVDWSRPLHVVVIVDERRREERIVTIYEPDSNRWTSGYRRRR